MTTATSQASRIGRPCAAFSRWTALAALQFGFVLAVQSAAGQETLTGTGTNSATGQNLEGARVVLKGTGREVFTDRMGVYRFPDVAPGSVLVSVSYTGLNPMNIPVEVTTGGRNRADAGLTAGIYTLDKFVVAGEREGNARATRASSYE